MEQFNRSERSFGVDRPSPNLLLLSLDALNLDQNEAEIVPTR